MLTKTIFNQKLHQALLDLYDNASIRKSPLLSWFDLTHNPNPTNALQELLTKEVQRMKPGATIPLGSQTQRIYKILQYRFLEQLGQKETASEMLLSVRHLRRLEQQAITELGEILWSRYLLEQHPDFSPQAGDQESPPTGEVASRDPSPLQDLPTPLPLEPPNSATEQELAWARQSLPEETVLPHELVESARRTLEPLLSSRQVRFQNQVQSHLPALQGKVGLIRQALVTLLTRLVESCPRGEIEVAAEFEGDLVVFMIKGVLDCPQETPGEFDPGQATSALAVAFDGSLEVFISTAEGAIHARITVPVSPWKTILMIDDNSDALTLVERYLSGTRFHLAALREPALAIETAMKLSPAMILLDVMLPGMDGWELLGRLRAHPALAQIPVVVCTFLNQKELALALGASEFLLKPLRKDHLLEKIEQVIQFQG